MFSQKPSRKSSANNANPERHRNLRPIPGIRRSPGESPGSIGGIGTKGPHRGCSDGGLGVRKTPAKRNCKNRGRAIAFRMAQQRKWSSGHLFADVVAVPSSELESGGQTIFESPIAEF